MNFLRLGNLLAAVLTTCAVYFSGDSTSGYAIFYLWIGFYVFYYPVSRLEAALRSRSASSTTRSRSRSRRSRRLRPQRSDVPSSRSFREP